MGGGEDVVFVIDEGEGVGELLFYCGVVGGEIFGMDEVGLCLGGSGDVVGFVIEKGL